MQVLESMSQFEQLQKAHATLVAVFYANWCPDCRYIDDFMPLIEAQQTDKYFVQVDYDTYQSLAQLYQVTGIPSFIVFENGQETKRFVSKLRKTQAEIMTFLTDEKEIL